MLTVSIALSTVSSYPSQLDAAMAAYHHLISSLSIPAEKIFISGDSAGGESRAMSVLCTASNAIQPI